MNLREIVSRDITAPFDLKEIEFVISEYLFVKKGVRVPLDTQATISTYPTEFQALILQQQIPLALVALDKARVYFTN